MISQLILDIPDTCDVRTLRVNDSSFYNPKIEVECGLLEVTAPGYIESINFNVAEAFSIVLNSSNLKMSKVKVYKDLQALPDGIYTFKYSIKPNPELWVEYDHLRITKIMRDYYLALSDVKLQPYPLSSEVRKKLRDLREIKSYIDAAKAEVEYKANRIRGKELYSYAQNLLNDTCKTCKI